MKPALNSLSKSEAVAYMNRTKRPHQIYLKRFDVEVVYRRGKLDESQVESVRYKEDARPQKVFNKALSREVDKKNDLVTYRHAGANEVYVLARSGGVSLFDGISSKVKLGNKDAWWVITKNAKVEEGLIIAKDVFKDAEGNTHYSIEPDRDMPISEYIEKLRKLKQYMKRI